MFSFAVMGIINFLHGTRAEEAKTAWRVMQEPESGILLMEAALKQNARTRNRSFVIEFCIETKRKNKQVCIKHLEKNLSKALPCGRTLAR